jgi:hypothetical protein
MAKLDHLVGFDKYFKDTADKMGALAKKIQTERGHPTAWTQGQIEQLAELYNSLASLFNAVSELVNANR